VRTSLNVDKGMALLRASLRGSNGHRNADG
jgi:hypothetical protein